MPKNKKLEDSSDSDSGPEDRNPPPSAKKSKFEEKKTKGDDDSNKGDATKWELERNRFVSISEFKGRKLLDIREYYKDKSSGETKPGKKGITLSRTEWDMLQKLIPEINKQFH